MPPRPQPRASEISDEIMTTFDRALTLRAEIEEREDELGAVEKRLIWSLLPEAFGDHWGPHCTGTSPADAALDEVRHVPAGGDTRYVEQVRPLLQRDRQVLLEAHRQWKQRKPRGPDEIAP